MDNKGSNQVTVGYSNLTYAYMKFQEQYKLLCEGIADDKRKNLEASFKKVKAFIYEYLPYIKLEDLKDYFTDAINKLFLELYDDIEFFKLIETPNHSITQTIYFNQQYYYYLTKLYRVIGLYGDELSKSFMPTKTDRKRIVKYWNHNFFYEQFTYYKSNTTQKVSEFNTRKFKQTFSYFLGFYFAYYLFIDEKSRTIIEKTFSNMLNIYLNRNILNLILTDPVKLTNEKRKLLRDIDFNLHTALTTIYYRCNSSFSNYGVIPKVRDKITLDRTTI